MDGLQHDDAGDSDMASESVLDSTLKWARFVGAGGDALPLQPKATGGVHKCGTDSTGWLSGCPRNAGGHVLADGHSLYRGPKDYHCNTPGRYPEVSEGIMEAVACFVDGGEGSCTRTEAVSVVNCGSFLLWRLNRPVGSAWPSAYCTVESGLFPTDGGADGGGH